MDNDRLFTPRFFMMCGFTFTVFLSALQLLPTAPCHITDLGGSRFQSGLFLGLLTYASAFSAPLTGTIADHFGRRRLLVASSLIIAGFSVVYAVTPSVVLLLVVVPVHGIVWSGLLSASAAYLTSILPAHRRSEGIGYWGLASVVALAVAPPIGFWMYRFGWFWLCLFAAGLNLVMAGIAWKLEETDPPREGAFAAPRDWIEWRVLLLSAPLFLYSYGYGAVTSFSSVYADRLGVHPRSIFLTTLAIVILLTRPFFGRLGDRFGFRQVFFPCLVLIALGLALLSLAEGRHGLVAAAVVFGLGFGTAYPVFAAFVTHAVPAGRRGAAFGAVLAAFDTGIGTGSTASGWLIERLGFPRAFGVAAVLAAAALPAAIAAGRFAGESSPEEAAEAAAPVTDWP